jgi:hypothetical protein
LPPTLFFFLVVLCFICDDELSSSQIGVVAAVIPDPNHPEFSVYWLRDACLVYHPWLNELTVLGDKSLRPMADDLTHALIRTQQVVSLAGNIFTGGIAEAVWDIHINPIQSEDARIGSPAAGEWFWLGLACALTEVTTQNYFFVFGLDDNRFR